MTQQLNHRKANLDDLAAIIQLLQQDVLGQTREQVGDVVDQRYVDAFHAIDADPNQYLMVVSKGDEIVATCHLTIMPSLTFIGSIRMQIEAVRVLEKYRGERIGQWMMEQAITYAKISDVSMIQLTTNEQRSEAKRFYKKLGFVVTHVGMKMHVD